MMPEAETPGSPVEWEWREGEEVEPSRIRLCPALLHSREPLD